MKLTPSGYRPRLWDSLLGRRFAGFGAVEVAGTKCILARKCNICAPSFPTFSIFGQNV